MLKPIAAAIAVIFITLAGVGAGAAENAAPIKRTVLQKYDIPGTNYQAVVAIAEIGPKLKSVGRHTHPGPESGYVLRGSMTLMREGQPPLPLKTGQSYLTEAGVAHDASTGPRGVKVIATYIVEKGKPLASPAK